MENQPMFYKSMILLILFVTSSATDLTISLTNATTWNNTLSTIGWNEYGEMTFCDLSWDCFRTNWDLSQIWEVNPITPPGEYRQVKMNLNLTLTNGSVLEIKNEISVYLRTPPYEIRYNSYPDQIFLESHWFTDLLGFYSEGLPRITRAAWPYTVGIAANVVQFTYINYVQDFTPSGFPSNVVSAEPISHSHSNNGDLLIINIRFFITSAEPKAYFVDVTVRFLFIHGTQQFDYASYSSSITLFSPTAYSYTKMYKVDDLIYMETADSMFAAVFRISDSLLTQTSAVVPSNSVSQFFDYFGDYYVVVSTGIVKLRYDFTTNTLTFRRFTSPTYPASTYQVAFTRFSAILIELGTTKTYTTVPPFVPPLINFYSLGLIESIKDWLVMMIQACIALPGARRYMSPLFYFFGVFDDLFLFQFHDRTYGETMTAVFENIDQIEEAKWGMINYQTVLKIFGINCSQYQKATEYQEPYLSFDFRDPYRPETGSEGLISNCQNFFLVSLPLTIAGYLMFWAVFRLAFHHPVSQIFRKFDFLAFLFILLFDGNVQQFSFHLSAELQALFFFSCGQKFLKLLLLLMGCVLVVGSTGFYLVCFRQYGKLNRHLMDNNRNSLAGQLLLIAQIGFRNLVFGILNSFLRYLDYSVMLTCLILVDCAFLGLFTVALSHGIYMERFKMWIFLLLGLNKVLLVCTLFIDYQSINQPLVESAQQVLILTTVFIFILGIAVELIVCINEIISSVYLVLGHKKNSSQPQTSKINSHDHIKSSKQRSKKERGGNQGQRNNNVKTGRDVRLLNQNDNHYHSKSQQKRNNVSGRKKKSINQQHIASSQLKKVRTEIRSNYRERNVVQLEPQQQKSKDKHKSRGRQKRDGTESKKAKQISHTIKT